jgi:hypothetical protein
MHRLRCPVHLQSSAQKFRSVATMPPYLERGANPAMRTSSAGDLNNVMAMRATEPPIRDHEFAYRSLAISASSEDPEFRQRYRPFLLDAIVQDSDWISRLELATVTKMAAEDLKTTGKRLRVLVMYGSMRKRYETRPPDFCC